MLKGYTCPDCGLVVSDGSTSCIRCGCGMKQIRAGKRTPVKLPYTEWAGHNDVKSAPKDKYGNPNGSHYDLLRDGSMKGYKILIINFQPVRKDREDFTGPIKALEGKGFEVKYTTAFPVDFYEETKDVCQVWLLSGATRKITAEQIKLLKNFYLQGKGIYLWSDNDPLFADTNPIIKDLFGSSMSGDYYATKVLSVQKNSRDIGIVAGHLMSTGVNTIYEGITISNVAMNQYLKPLIYSSDRKVVTAYSDYNGCRALIDGGYTRLYNEYWDTAGTDRYIVNAAGWLANFEKFGWKIPQNQ